MKKIILSVLFFCSTITLFSATITARFSGFWNSGLTWVGGVVPGNNDIVIIPSDRTVILNITTPVYTNMTIEIYGGLRVGQISDPHNLNMDANGVINVYSGGRLVGTAGSDVVIGGTIVFSGLALQTGPWKYTKNGGTPLPIELSTFNAKAKAENDQVVLSWTTATEVNNDFFTIERSIDGRTFEIVGTLKGSGNSSTSRTYSFVDTRPYNGTSYYRLKQTDYDGKNETFGMVAVSINKIVGFTVFPNPSNGKNVSVQFNGLEEELVVLNVCDITGKEILNKVITAVDGVNTIQLDADLTKGTYLVKTTNANSVAVQRMVVE